MAIERYRDFTPRLGGEVFIHPSATVIGDVVIGDQASIWPNAVVRGDVNSIRIGPRCNIQDGAILHVSHRRASDPEGAPLVLGRDVSVGHGVILHGCKVGDECLIGMGALVMDKAVLEPRVLLGAGSLVPEGRVLPSGWLYLGRPARAVRPLSAPRAGLCPARPPRGCKKHLGRPGVFLESQDELDYFAYLSAGYVRLAKDYLG